MSASGSANAPSCSEALAGFVVALSDPDQIGRRVERDEGGHRVDQPPDSSHRDDRISFSGEQGRLDRPAWRVEAEQLSARKAKDLREAGWVAGKTVLAGESLELGAKLGLLVGLEDEHGAP